MGMRLTVGIISALSIAVLVLSFALLDAWSTDEVHCGPERMVQLTGTLQGYATNSFYHEYTDVRIDGVNYTFNIFNRDIAVNFVGKNVEVNCCFYQNTTENIKDYYDMISIYITGE